MATRQTKTRYQMEFDSTGLYPRGYLTHQGGTEWKGWLRYKDGDAWRMRTKRFNNARNVSEAKQRLREWHDALEAESALGEEGPCEVDSSPVTVGDCLDYELAIRETQGREGGPVQRSTMAEYRHRVRYLIAPYLGDVPVAGLTEKKLTGWIRALRDDGYSDSTIRKALSFVRSTLEQAVRDGHCTENVARGVKCGKYKPAKKSNALDARSLRVLGAMLAAELDCDDPAPFHLGVALALYTGMRREEICGLRWKCVDIDAGVIKVREAIGFVSDTGEYYVKEPKSDDSEREVYFSGELLGGALRRRRVSMQAECLERKVPFSDEMFVLGGVDGSFMLTRYLTQRWSKLAEGNQFMGTEGRRATFHDLRHTYATLAIENGADVVAVSKMMGHADTQITFNRYAASHKEKQQEVAEIMAGCIEESAANPVGEVAAFPMTGTEG